MTNDKYGVKQLFPSTGLEWYNKWDNGKERKLGLSSKEIDPYDPRLKMTCGSPDRNIVIKGDGAARYRSDTPVTSIRIYVEGPWLNTEMTCYIKKMGALPDFHMRSRSNHASKGSEYNCTFGNYRVAWFDSKYVDLAVEPMHPIYMRGLVKKPFVGFIKDKYLGFKQITRTLGGNKVKVESYVDKDSNQNWIKDTEFIFDGTNVKCEPTGKDEEYRKLCVDKGDKVANDLTKACLWLKQGQRCWLRLNYSTGWNLKWFSIREIAPL